MPRTVSADEARPLDLDQQKKLAKELRRALARGDGDALARFRRSHPKAGGLTDGQIAERLAKVTEAQHVIARELGLPSWPRLRTHIERYAAAQAEVAAGAPVLDDDPPTTHVRCGTDIRTGLRRAGLHGRFAEFSDPYCQGPVPRDGDLIEIRARFIAEAYGEPLEEARGHLLRAMRGLEATISRERVVLWFEHDSFDQLILARILAFYGERGAPRSVELVHADGFPGVGHFKGLGELSATALRLLWDDRLPVTPELVALGTRVWTALRDPSPAILHEAASTSDVLPRMGTAIVRHLQELPWGAGGLSLTQRLTLELVERRATAGELFVRLTNEREPLPYLGDAMWWAVVRDMLAAGRPPIAVDDTERRPWHERRLALTATGDRLLAGQLDWMACEPRERWVGGVVVAPGKRNWRWDPVALRPMMD